MSITSQSFHKSMVYANACLRLKACGILSAQYDLTLVNTVYALLNTGPMVNDKGRYQKIRILFSFIEFINTSIERTSIIR